MLPELYAWLVTYVNPHGMQMNYNKLCACITEDAIHPEFEASLAKVPPRPSWLSFCFDSTALVWLISA